MLAGFVGSGVVVGRGCVHEVTGSVCGRGVGAGGLRGVVGDVGRGRVRSLDKGSGGVGGKVAVLSAVGRQGLDGWRLSGGGPGFGGGGGGEYGGGGDGWQHEDWDWSWRLAPGVHVFLRGRVEDARLAVKGVVDGVVEVVSNVDSSKPMVILLSWMGASRKNLDKYRAYYEGLNYEVHMIFNGLRTSFLPLASRAQAKRVEKLIASQPEERAVFVHAFSIGTGIYGLLIDQLKGDMEKMERIRKQIAGVIFDSGPAPIFPRDVAKGLHTVCPSVSKAVWEITAKAMFFVTQARKSFERSENALRGLQGNSPQLYFYSLDDKVIPDIHHAIGDFMEKNRQRGMEVYQKWWDKSVHASHFKLHQEEYLQSLQRFLDRCLELRMSNSKASSDDSN